MTLGTYIIHSLFTLGNMENNRFVLKVTSMKGKQIPGRGFVLRHQILTNDIENGTEKMPFSFSRFLTAVKMTAGVNFL